MDEILVVELVKSQIETLKELERMVGDCMDFPEAGEVLEDILNQCKA